MSRADLTRSSVTARGVMARSVMTRSVTAGSIAELLDLRALEKGAGAALPAVLSLNDGTCCVFSCCCCCWGL